MKTTIELSGKKYKRTVTNITTVTRRSGDCKQYGKVKINHSVYNVLYVNGNWYVTMF